MSSRWQVTPRWHKLTLSDTNIKTYQQASTRRRSLLWSLDHPVRRMIQVTGNKYLHAITVITKKALMPRMCTRTRRDARSVEIQYTLKVSSVQQSNFNANLATSVDTLQTYVIKRNKLHSSQGDQSPICCKQELCMFVTSPYVATQQNVFVQQWVILSASKNTVDTSWM